MSENVALLLLQRRKEQEEQEEEEQPRAQRGGETGRDLLLISLRKPKISRNPFFD